MASKSPGFRAGKGRSFATLPFKRTAPSGAGEVWLAARGTRFVETDSGHERILLFLDDVTAQVRLQKQLNERDKIAGARTLLAHVARDLDNRLDLVVGHTRMLQQGRIGIAEMAHVNAIERVAREAKRAIEGLLAQGAGDVAR